MKALQIPPLIITSARNWNFLYSIYILYYFRSVKYRLNTGNPKPWTSMSSSKASSDWLIQILIITRTCAFTTTVSTTPNYHNHTQPITIATHNPD